jgi:hypothetical protein
LKEEEIQPSELPFKFEEGHFEDFENTSNCHHVREPRAPIPSHDSVEKVKGTLLYDSPESLLEAYVVDFIEEIDDSVELIDLSEFETPSRPPIELKPLPAGFVMPSSTVTSNLLLSLVTNSRMRNPQDSLLS